MMTFIDVQKWRGSRNLIVLVVAVALCLDNIILTVIVPILPAILYEIDNPNHSENLRMDSYSATGETLSGTKPDGFMQESAKVGFMLASKSVVQLIANPIVGPLTDKFGYIKPMFVGFVVMFTSTLLFAFGNNYPVLFFARAFQGIGSSCSSVAGLALLAKTFPDKDEREKAMALAFTGLSFGVIFGPPFGGIMYQLVNKTAPFLTICFFTLIDGCLLLITMQVTDETEKKNSRPPTIWALMKDKYILLAAGGIFMFQISTSILETGLPIWMSDTMDASRLETGLSLLPCTVFYLLGINTYGPVLKRTGTWLGSVLALCLSGVAFIGLSMVRSKIVLILPLVALGFFCGATEISLLPELSHIVDVRHASVYGNVYAIGDFALCLGFGIGPILCGLIMNGGVGFDYVALGSGIACILYSPLLALLKYIDEEKEEKQPLLDS